MEKPKEQHSLVKEISSHPLFSILTTSSLLILLYSPHLLPLLIFSPVVVSTSLLLTALLHLGSSDPQLVSHRIEVPSEEEEDPITEVIIEPEDNMRYVEYEQKTKYSCESNSVQWGWRGSGPLEVIYEGDDNDEDDDNDDDEEEAYNGPQRRSLDFMRFYDTDSDSDSSCEEELGDHGMIEIALEEDNLIEIDIRNCR